MYVTAVRNINIDVILPKVMMLFRQSKFYAELNGKEITGYNIIEEEGQMYLIVYTKCVCPQCITELKNKFLLKDLGIDPEAIYGFYSYVFNPKREIKRGDAIRIVKEADESDPSYFFSYNACVITSTPKQLTFITPASAGPMIRYLTARDCYIKNIQVYKFKNPDDLEYFDNEDKITDCIILRDGFPV